MSNCLIYLKNSDEIKFFVKDCRIIDDPKQKGLDYIGSNIKLISIKSEHYNIKWTNEESTPVYDDENKLLGYKEKVSEITEAPFFKEKPTSTSDDVNKIIKETIAKEYTLEDEIKILRKKILGILSDEEWNTYNSYIESLLSDANDFKENVLKENK